MKLERVLITFLLLAGGVAAQAHDVDPGGRIVVACSVQHGPRMSEVTRAIDESHYWAPQSARKEILALARQACDSGSSEVVFVPSADQRYAVARESTKR